MAQRLIVEGLSRFCPDDGIIGEESDGGAGHHRACAARAGARTWVIDPIDGTNNYVAPLGCWAVCIASHEHGHAGRRRGLRCRARAPVAAAFDGPGSSWVNGGMESKLAQRR